MPYTFGAGAGDDIVTAAGSTALASATAFATMGWYLPTTLTTGRCLWSTGSGSTGNAILVGTTTSEIDVFTNNATTPGQWTTTGLGMTVDQWQFIAVFITVNDTGPAGAVRVWAGRIDSAPTEIAVTATTAPVGAFSGSSNWYCGNRGTGTVSFQGDIANVVCLAGSGAGSTPSLLVPTATGAITQIEADLFRDAYVLPCWLGDYYTTMDRGRGSPTSAQLARWFTELNTVLSVGRSNSTTIPVFVVNTINGATESKTGCPRPPTSRPQWPLRRR